MKKKIRNFALPENGCFQQNVEFFPQASVAFLNWISSLGEKAHLVRHGKINLHTKYERRSPSQKHVLTVVFRLVDRAKSTTGPDFVIWRTIDWFILQKYADFCSSSIGLTIKLYAFVWQVKGFLKELNNIIYIVRKKYTLKIKKDSWWMTNK